MSNGGKRAARGNLESSFNLGEIGRLTASAGLNRLFTEYFPENPPARMVMQVPLPKALLISIGCVAAVES